LIEEKDHQQITVTFFPPLKLTTGNPYNKLLIDSLAKEGIETIENNNRFNLSFLLRNRKRVSIIHFHWPSIYYKGRSPLQSLSRTIRFCTLLPLSRIMGYRIFWTVHNLYPHEMIRVLHHKIARRLLVILSNGLFIHFKGAEGEIRREFGGNTKFYLIPHGNYIGFYDKPMERQSVREMLDLKDEFVYLIFGRFRAYKDVSVSAKRFLLLAPSNSILLIAGEPRDKSSLQGLEDIADASGNRIRLFLKDIPDNELPLYFAASDCVWLSYRRIFTSGNLLLSYSMKKPVIAPDAPFFREMVTPSSGVLYDPNDDLSLQHALLSIQGLDRIKAGEEAYRIALECSWDKVAGITAQAYREALRED